MSAPALTAPNVEQADRLLRHLTPEEALEAGILTPMAGTRPVRLFSIEEAERFLKVYDKSAVDFDGTWAKVNYVDPMRLAAWIGETLGDAELADAVGEIAKSREPYGFLVPDLKSAIAARIEQARVAAGVSAGGTVL